MKFQVSMKDPDTLHDAIDDACKASVADICDEEEREAVYEVRRQKARGVAARWFKYSEYLTVEVDTEADTCTVIPAC